MEDRKPNSMSMKDWLIRRLAPKMLLSEKTIETVINHQFQSANEALASNRTLEISGFGKLIFNHKKAVKKLLRLEAIKAALEKQVLNEQLDERKRRTAATKLQSVTEAIAVLKPKVNNEEHIPVADI